jgi:hypothetical protein
MNRGEILLQICDEHASLGGREAGSRSIIA